MTYEVYLAHHGIKGQRWGVRRYQNEDGSLTAAGRDRYMKKSEGIEAKADDRYWKAARATQKLTKGKRMGGRFKKWLVSDIFPLNTINSARFHNMRTKQSKARRSAKKAANYFEKEIPTFKTKKLSDSDVARLSQLGESAMARWNSMKPYKQSGTFGFSKWATSGIFPFNVFVSAHDTANFLSGKRLTDYFNTVELPESDSKTAVRVQKNAEKLEKKKKK